MVALGHAVEAVIGKAKQAQIQVSTRGGVQPVLSLESQFKPARLRELTEAFSQKTIGQSIPEMKGAAAIEIGEGPAIFVARFLALQAGMAIGVEMGGGSVGSQGDPSRGFVVRASGAKLPFANNRFSYFIARMATSFQGDIARTTREISRVLTPGGQGVVIDYHPFGLFAKRGANRARPADSGVSKIEDYYRLCKQSGMRVVDLREALIDEGMRQFFKEEEIQAYRNLKGSPFLIFLFVYKPKSSA